MALTHGQAMDAIEAAFTAKATDTRGNINYCERSTNVCYAARMLVGFQGGYVDSIDALAREFTDSILILDLPGRALRARS